MKKFVYWAASKLPMPIVFGQSYRDAMRIHAEYCTAEDASEFVRKYIDFKLKNLYQLAQQCDFYRDYDFSQGITSLGFIDKDAVLSAGASIVRTRFGADLVTTGGTSGKPLAFYIDKSRKGFEWYWMTVGWVNAGFDRSISWRGVLRNHDTGSRDFIRNPLLKELQFNNFGLSDSYLDKITKIISDNNIEFIHAYPSAAYTLAAFWRESSKTPACVKAFLCGSENVLHEQKKIIQCELGIRMHTWYGHSEKLVLAHEGVECQNYHANPFYGYTEIIKEDGFPAVNLGEVGEIVGTGFVNTKTPFIRYRTGDYAEYIGETCPSCGHIGVTFRNVRGRWDGDKIYLANGSFVSTTALNLHDDIYSVINGLQYFQDKSGMLEVRILPGNSWSVHYKNKLIEDLRKKIPAHLIFKVIEVDNLEYSKNRKFQLLIQRIPSP